MNTTSTDLFPPHLANPREHLPAGFHVELGGLGPHYPKYWNGAAWTQDPRESHAYADSAQALRQVRHTGENVGVCVVQA